MDLLVKVRELKQLTRIWQVLSEQYKVKLDLGEITALTKALPNISGRSVRNILKLGVLLNGASVTVEDLLSVSQYQAVETKR